MKEDIASQMNINHLFQQLVTNPFKAGLCLKFAFYDQSRLAKILSCLSCETCQLNFKSKFHNNQRKKFGPQLPQKLIKRGTETKSFFALSLPSNIPFQLDQNDEQQKKTEKRKNLQFA